MGPGSCHFQQRHKTKFQFKEEILRGDCRQAQRLINQDGRPISDCNERLKATGILLVETLGEISTALAMMPELESNEVM